MINEIIKELALKAIDEKLFPGVVIGITDPEKTLFMEKYGTLDEKKPTEFNSLYDIASLTKVTATLPAMLKLIQDGKVDLSDKVSDHTEFPNDDIRIWHLMTHTSGMPPYSLAYQFKDTREEIIDEIKKEQFKELPQTRVRYSCLNYILLMDVINSITGNFREYVRNEVFKPLGMDDTDYLPEISENIAPTSLRDGLLLRGKVDDELAYYLGGISGNAGLYSNLTDMLKYARELLNPVKVLSKPMMNTATRPWTKDIPGDDKGLGWMLYTNDSSGGSLLSEKAFGHTGFTGTSLWVDPVQEIAIVILSNRCFYSRHERITEIWRFRRTVSNALVSHLK
ncbi:MAG TPA: serine hydrolase domain-containing protein [Thermotogota bacterium]|nr:serine hydrolase domain-containing protein [Thermotogota bacterium]HPJ89510.1 serine hydrolase domain-containing protein [Thermotogota bacterium]HPR96611.1 serine hydrolase domain-containing protein [Thermotogota bacterium]